MTHKQALTRLRVAAGQLTLSETITVNKEDLRAILELRILGPNELDLVTVERCAAIADACEAQQEIDNGAANTGGAAFAAASIRSLSPTQPEAKEARE